MAKTSPGAKVLLALLQALDFDVSEALQDALRTVHAFSALRTGRDLITIECDTAVVSVRLEFNLREDMYTTDCRVAMTFQPGTTMPLRGCPSKCHESLPPEWSRLAVLDALCSVVQTFAEHPALAREML
jgi:hypothetical protein